MDLGEKGVVLLSEVVIGLEESAALFHRNDGLVVLLGSVGLGRGFPDQSGYLVGRCLDLG